MADPTGMASIPPGVDPTDWLQTQRQMALAQALQGMALTPAQNDVQQPAGGGKYYQAARVRPITALSKLAEALMAKKGFDQSLPAMAQQYGQAQQAFAPGGQIVPTGQSVITAGPQGAPEGPVPAPRTPTYTQTPQNPYNPQGLPAATMMRLYQSDPGKYASMIAGPEGVQTGQFAGMDRQSAAQAVFNKQNAIDLRSGGMVRLPNGQIIRAPNLPPGYEPEFDGQGNLVGTHPSPGLIQGEAQRAGAVTAAEVGNKPIEVDMGGGVKRLVYPGDVLPAPPANRAPPSNAANAPQYFKGALSAAPMPQPPPSARPSGPAGVAGGGPVEWLQNAPKVQIPHTPGQSTDSYTQKILDKTADKHIELADKYGSEADLADARIAFNNEAIALLKNGNPEMGPLSDKLTKLRARAEEMGVPADWIPGGNKVQDTQEIKKYFLRNPLLNLKPTFGGRPAAAEFQVLRTEASPSEEMLSGAAQKLLQIDNTQAGYVKQRAEDYGQYHAAGGDPLRFESYYAKTHPFAQALGKEPKASAVTKQISGKTYYSLGGGRWSDSPP